MKTKSTLFIVAFLLLSFLVTCSKDNSIVDQLSLKSGSGYGNVPADKKGNVNVTVTDFGSDGALYISNIGFGPPTGQILKVVF